MVVRVIEVLLLVFNWIVLICASENIIDEFKYLTIWGMFVTLISVVMSFWFCKDAEEKVLLENPNKFLSLWKWYIFFFELAMSFEVVIAPYFWAFLWSVWDDTKGIEYLNLILCHSISIAILALEFLCINALPISLRHYSVIFALCVLYMIDNIIVCKVTGKDVYPGMSWNSVAGCLMPCAVFVISFIFYLIMVCISKCKMKKID